MKRTNIATIALVVLITLLAAASCNRAPEEEMTAAAEAVRQAESNPDVEKYAPQSLQAARQRLSEMESAAENGEYDSARSLAEEAVSAADQAVRDAATVKSRGRDRAESAVGSASAALAEAQDALTRGKNVAGIRFNFQAAETELSRISGVISTAEEDLAAEAFAEAQAGAEQARSSLSDLTRRLSEATEAVSRK